MTAGSSGFGRSADFSSNHRHALNSAIGIRSSDTRQQPYFPDTVRSPGAAGSLTGSIVLNSMYGEGVGQFPHEASLFQNSLSTAASGAASGAIGGTGARQLSPVRGGALEGSQSFSSGYDAHEVRNTIAERERHFFKEVSLNPNLKDQHPLMHLISAQQKLKLIDEQSGVLASKTANKAESIFGTRYGKQSDDAYKKNAPYATEIPYAVNGEIILPSKLKQRKLEEVQKSKMRKSRSLKALLDPGSLQLGEASVLEADGAHGVHRAAGAHAGSAEASVKSYKSASTVSQDPIVKSSQRHRDYLLESLKRIEDSVLASGAYAGHYTGGLDDVAAASANNSPSGKYGAGSKSRSPSTKKGFSAKVSSPGSRSPSQRIAKTGAADPPAPNFSHTMDGATESALLDQWGVAQEGSLTEGSLERREVAEQAESLLVPVDGNE
jgi:hypothetical protein